MSEVREWVFGGYVVEFIKVKIVKLEIVWFYGYIICL